MSRRVLVGAGVLSLLVPAMVAAGPAGADDDPRARFQQTTQAGPVDPVSLPPSLDTTPVTVMVEFSKDSVATAKADRGGKLSASQKSSVKKAAKAQQNAAKGAIASRGGKVEGQLQAAINAVRVSIPKNKVASLEQIEGVTAVLEVPVVELDNSTSVPFLGVPQVWKDHGYTGEGVKVGIIDTGIDYTHADFGGPGTIEAYEAAKAAGTSAPSPDFGWGVRVKGGYDFVGDDYDASKDGSVAKPDPNPLDCQGHGSHVAGSTGGSGVLPDGSTYTGPYDTTTHEQEFKVGPGVAPEVDLYALRVFGCGGSTDVTTEAIDWAVDNDLDVINMSLGSPYGKATHSSAVAASNAVAAGVVVVASAGNSGPNPYLSGSPGVGTGVVNVAAVDSTESFPGATLSFDGKTVAAINANNAELPAGPYEIVVLEDDPATPGNEALGCTAEDYTSNGISADPGAPLQIAVTVRGTCARAARAVYGQQAGADAVVMINTTADYPPLEGKITGDPDVPGHEYDVTIPFLGVRGVLGSAPTEDGDWLVAADGKPLTLAETSLENPGFRAPASFTSGGPRSGDSAVSPSLSAPGVSIVSAGVGTGAGSATMSGTSMAAPHAAGVAALGVQAHPGWTAEEMAASMITTADADGVAGSRVTLTGAGLVDTAQLVTGNSLAYGSSAVVDGSEIREGTVSFGFAETGKTFSATETVTVVNKGSSPITYAVGTRASEQSQAATVTASPSSVTVPAGGTAKVKVTLSAPASSLPSILDGAGQHRFYEISGFVTLSSSDGDLAVPYLLVPRPEAAGKAAPKSINHRPKKGAPINLVNTGAVATSADFYEWGISDPDEDHSTADSNGFDIRAAGVQSFDTGADGTMMVFAINTWDRYSNAASNEYDVNIDVDRDGKADWQVFTYDSGLVRAGNADGRAEVFMVDLATGGMYAAGFLAQAPTDNSTILLPVMAADLGVEGAFDYTVAASGLHSGSDSVDGKATYDPTAPVLSSTGEYKELKPGQKARVTAKVDAAGWKANGTKGAMVVFMDNHSGAAEAALLPIK